jgi:hypothetical protein
LHVKEETLIVSAKELGLEVDEQKSKYTLLSHHQNAGKCRKKIGNINWECGTVEIFGKYTENVIQEVIKRRVNSGNTCFLSAV